MGGDGPAAVRHRLAYPALVAGAIGIGLAPLFVRWIHVHDGVGTTATAFWRMLLSLPVFVALAARVREDGARPGPGRGWLIISGIFFAADLTLWHWSLVETSIANSTLLSNLAPIFVTIGAALLFAHRVSGGFAIALALTFAGAACLVSSSFRLDTAHVAGDGVATASAVAYAAYLLAVARLRRRWSAATIMAWSGASSCAAFAAVAWLRGEQFLPNGAGGWIALALFALIAQILGQALVAFALEGVSAPFASLVLLIQPVIATVLAWPLFAEPIGGLQAVGAVIVVIGIMLARRAV